MVFRRTLILLFLYHQLQNKSWHQWNGWKVFLPVPRAVEVPVMMSNFYHFIFYCQCTSKQIDGYNMNWFWTYDTCTCDTILSCILVLVLKQKLTQPSSTEADNSWQFLLLEYGRDITMVIMGSHSVFYCCWIFSWI